MIKILFQYINNLQYFFRTIRFIHNYHEIYINYISFLLGFDLIFMVYGEIFIELVVIHISVNFNMLLDFGKACDLVTWNFLDYMVIRFFFNKKWMSWMRTCMFAGNFEVLVTLLQKIYFKTTFSSYPTKNWGINHWHTKFFTLKKLPYIPLIATYNREVN